MYAAGSTIDSSMNLSSGPRFAFAAAPSRSSRSGPDLTGRAGRLERVAAAAPVLLEDGEPGGPAAAAAALHEAASNFVRGADVGVAAHERMAEAAELGADDRERAGRVGVITSELVCPGTASCFCENSGTQNEWMTSLAVIRASRAGPWAASGSRRSCRSGT